MTRRLVRALAVLGALAGAALLGAVPTAVATPDGGPPSRSIARTGAAGDPHAPVSVTAISPAVLTPGADLHVTAVVRNLGTVPLAEPAVVVSVRRSGFLTRTQLAAWTEDGAGSVTALAKVPVAGPIEPGGTRTVDVTVPAGTTGLPGRSAAWGARGLVVDLLDAATTVGAQRTFLVWYPGGTVSPTHLTMLVPLVNPGPNPDAAAQAELLAGAASPQGSLGSALAATAGHPEVGWAVDPSLLTAAATSSEPHAASWWRSFAAASAGREIAVLPWGDPDLGALAHADRPGLLTAARDESTRAVSALTGLQGALRSDIAWPAARVDGPTVGLAAGTGAAAVVVDGADLATGEDLTYTPSGRADLTQDARAIAALVPDATLSGLIGDDDDASAAVRAQRVLAETAVITRERPNDSRHLLVTAPREWSADAETVSTVLDALESAPWVAMDPLSALLATPDPGVARAALPDRAASEGELSPGLVASLGDAAEELGVVSGIVADPAALVAAYRPPLLAPLAAAWRAEPTSRAGLADAALSEVAALRSGVAVVPGSAVNLISETGELPVVLRNDLDQPVTVRVALQPGRRLLSAETSDPVTVAARSELSVRLPVRAIANGNVSVSVVLETLEGQTLLVAEPFTIRVRADWENVGTAVIAAVLGVGVIAGLVRTARRGRSSRRGGPVPVLQQPDQQ